MMLAAQVAKGIKSKLSSSCKIIVVMMGDNPKIFQEISLVRTAFSGLIFSRPFRKTIRLLWSVGRTSAMSSSDG
jgi:hypothetical protein